MTTAIDIVKQLQEALKEIDRLASAYAEKAANERSLYCWHFSGLAGEAFRANALIPALLDALQGQEKVVSVGECAAAIEALFDEAKDDPTAGVDEKLIAKAVLTAAGVKYE